MGYRRQYCRTRQKYADRMLWILTNSCGIFIENNKSIEPDKNVAGPVDHAKQ